MITYAGLALIVGLILLCLVGLRAMPAPRPPADMTPRRPQAPPRARPVEQSPALPGVVRSRQLIPRRPPNGGLN